MLHFVLTCACLTDDWSEVPFCLHRHWPLSHPSIRPPLSRLPLAFGCVWMPWSCNKSLTPLWPLCVWQPDVWGRRPEVKQQQGALYANMTPVWLNHFLCLTTASWVMTCIVCLWQIVEKTADLQPTSALNREALWAYRSALFGRWKTGLKHFCQNRDASVHEMKYSYVHLAMMFICEARMYVNSMLTDLMIAGHIVCRR